MSYTTDELDNIINSMICQSADQGFKFIKAQLFNSNTQKCLYNKMLYVNGMIDVLLRYRDDTESCLEETDIDNIIEMIDQICGCNCCKDRNDIIKDISSKYLNRF